MTQQHEMSWERDTTEYVDDNNWVIREPTGSTLVTCSCGFSRTVSNDEAPQVMEEHRASTGQRL
ncbi:hypothetical protein [Streptomyces sp. NPDC058985]|uniref:hypothetical protein n=1 Tax=Streptomyces sp. NPDC058985 TaxID=3346684 RepID=UPI0036935E11